MEESVTRIRIKVWHCSSWLSCPWASYSVLHFCIVCAIIVILLWIFTLFISWTKLTSYRNFFFSKFLNTISIYSILRIYWVVYTGTAYILISFFPAISGSGQAFKKLERRRPNFQERQQPKKCVIIKMTEYLCLIHAVLSKTL